MLNVLYLVNKKTFMKKLPRERFHSINKLGEICNLHWSGIGWGDYDNSLTVQKNIDKISKDRKFDFVIAYKPLEMKEFKNVNVPKCLRYNEMYDSKWTLKEINESGAQLVVCHHLNDFEKYNSMNIPNVRFVYIGHCFEKTIFKDYGFDKKYDIMLGGQIGGGNVYPLRKRLREILKSLKSNYSIYIHKHPGYNLRDAHTSKYLIEFAKKMNQSKIVVSCSSKFRYRLGKYVEIPACNTVMAADKPYDKYDKYDHLIDINMGMTDEEIKQKIIHYLENNDEYEEKRVKGLEFAKNYTHESYAAKLLEEIVSYLDEK